MQMMVLILLSKVEYPSENESDLKLKIISPEILNRKI